MATAGSATVTTAETTIFEDSSGCTSFDVTVDSGSSNDVQVNVSGLHDSGEWFNIQVGDSRVFRLNNMGIRKVTAKGNGGSADIHYGVVAKTA